MSARQDTLQRIATDYKGAFSGGVSRGQVRDAEAHFTGTFPADFVEFLESLGTGVIDSEELYGLGGKPYLDIVKVALSLREPSSHAHFPDTLVPVSGDGYGNHDCINLAASSATASRVVAWLHDGGDEQAPEILADDYWSWLARILDEISAGDD